MCTFSSKVLCRWRSRPIFKTAGLPIFGVTSLNVRLFGIQYRWLTWPSASTTGGWAPPNGQKMWQSGFTVFSVKISILMWMLQEQQVCLHAAYYTLLTALNPRMPRKHCRLVEPISPDHRKSGDVNWENRCEMSLKPRLSVRDSKEMGNIFNTSVFNLMPPDGK